MRVYSFNQYFQENIYNTNLYTYKEIITKNTNCFKICNTALQVLETLDYITRVLEIQVKISKKNFYFRRNFHKRK